MLVAQTTEQIEKQYLDSMYLISHSVYTLKTYKSALNNFRKFLASQYSCDELNIVEQIKSEQIDVFTVLRDFIIYMDQKQIGPRAIRSYLSGLKGYLRHLGIKFSSDDFKQLVKVPKIIKTREIPVTKEMILRVLHNSSPKLQTAILVCASSGIRIGELVQLKLSDIDFECPDVNSSIRIALVGRPGRRVAVQQGHESVS